MTTSEQITTLSEFLYQDAWQNASAKPTCRSYMIAQLSKLGAIDVTEFLVHSFKTYEVGYNLAFMLSAPELWKGMDVSDWLRLMRLMSPRPTITYADQTGAYSDIAFFLAWLNLDSLELVTGGRSEISLADQAQICNYCRANADLLIRDEESLADLDGNVLCERRVVDEVRSRLLRQYPALEPPFHDADSLRDYSSVKFASVMKSSD